MTITPTQKKTLENTRKHTVCITCFSIRSRCLLENLLNALKSSNKKHSFSSESRTICDNIASNNLKLTFFFTICHSTCKYQAKYLKLILLLHGNLGTLYNFKLMVSTEKGMNLLHIHIQSSIKNCQEIRFIAKKSKATVIGSTEIKQKSILNATA